MLPAQARFVNCARLASMCVIAEAASLRVSSQSAGRYAMAQGKSRFVISPRCARLIEAFVCYHYPDTPTANELPLKDGVYDHPIDALRYFFINLRTYRREQDIGFIESNEGRVAFCAEKKKQDWVGGRGESEISQPCCWYKILTKMAHSAYGCGIISANSRLYIINNNYFTITQPDSTREISGKKHVFFAFPGEKQPAQICLYKTSLCLRKTQRFAYNRSKREKDWAAVRREERRELPQPVVIVLNLYAGRFE